MRRIVAIAFLLGWSIPARAGDGAYLDRLEVGRIGTASLVAGDRAEERARDRRRAEEPSLCDEEAPREEDRRADRPCGSTERGQAEPAAGVHGVVTPSLRSGSRHVQGWSGPRLVAGADVDAGVQLSPRDAVDVHAQLAIHPPGGIRDRTGASGRHHLLATFGLAGGGALAVDVALRGHLSHASDPDRGERAYDIGPAPFVDLRLAPTLWLTSARPEDGDRAGVALDYGVRATRYFGGMDGAPLTSHRVAAAVGLLEGRGGRSWVRMFEGGYSRHGFGSAAEPRHAIDASVVDLRYRFGKSEAGPHGFSRATVGLDVGWSVLRRPVGSWAHTPKMTLEAEYEGEIGRYGMAVGNRLAFAPSGKSAVAITYYQIIARIESDDRRDDGTLYVPVGGMLRAKGGRIEALPHGSGEAIGYVQGDAELYARLALLDIGAEGAIGHGLPVGSMGWDPVDGVARLWGALGGFVRMRTPLSGR